MVGWWLVVLRLSDYLGMSFPGALVTKDMVNTIRHVVVTTFLFSLVVALPLRLRYWKPNKDERGRSNSKKRLG